MQENTRSSYILFFITISLVVIGFVEHLEAGIPTGPPPEPVSYSVHSFDCQYCHGDFMSLTDDVADVFCLRCHKAGATPVAPPPNGWPPVTKEDGITPFHDGESDIHFTGDDASNVFGNNPGASLQTSHNWLAPTDRIPAAGASAPLDSRFYSNYGTSLDKITCSRCHLPHADTDNPKLLTMGPGSADAMCLDCHRSWNQSNNHGWLTHPLVVDYNAVVAAAPAKYKAQIDNKGRAGIQKVNGGISCTSCHGIHFVDSDASTPDSPYNVAGLSSSSGRLLRGDGSTRSDKSSFCQSCHTYTEHGNNSGGKAGCLVCHSGHSYDPSAPNYFVLRKTANSVTFGINTNLDYSSPDVIDPAKADNKYSFWADPVDDSGYCEKCHGEITSLPQTVHSAGAYCTECHGHSQVNGGSFGHPGGGDCTPCHTPDHVVSTEQVDWVTIFDPGSAHTNDDPPYSGPIYAYATCTMCHTTNLLTEHDSNCIFCHFGDSPPRDSFTNWDQSCQQGSCHATYHVDASDLHDEYYWRASPPSEPGYSCSKCHSASGFVVPWPGYEDAYLATADDCGACHTLRPDTYPPVVETDLQSDYIDSAIITLGASDPSGVNTIFYRLNGGATQTYTTPFTVTAPASGSEPHTLQYWARDDLGNVGSPGPGQTFTVHADTTPPVTTSNAKSLYGTDATIQLTATDDATSFPVAATYYKDGVGGTVQTGTTAVIPQPASGSETHTLYFWSVDNSGNVEAEKSVTFEIIANGLIQDSMPMGTNLWGYADPYWNTAWDSADPRVTYTIKIMDADTEPDTVLHTDTITRLFNSYYAFNNYQPTSPQTWTTYWACPPNIPVTAGDRVEITVDAEFSDQAFWAPADFPTTYTLTFPAGTVQLESVNWNFTTTMEWTNYEFVEDEYGEAEVSWIRVLPSVGNISYITTAP